MSGMAEWPASVLSGGNDSTFCSKLTHLCISTMHIERRHSLSRNLSGIRLHKVFWFIVSYVELASDCIMESRKIREFLPYQMPLVSSMILPRAWVATRTVWSGVTYFKRGKHSLSAYTNLHIGTVLKRHLNWGAFLLLRVRFLRRLVCQCWIGNLFLKPIYLSSACLTR